MKSEKTIEITFDVDGGMEVKAKGYKGRSCTDATAFIEKALGKKTNDTKTKEFYESDKSVLTIKR